MPSDQRPDRTPAELRSGAARCFALAARLPPGPEATMLTARGQEYLEMANGQDSPLGSFSRRLNTPRFQ
jgi:hypothetical protein